jgi:predicted enzyme related to lactoylglutathione lyase
MKMNYFVVGTNDMPSAMRFYDALFAEEGIEQWMSEGRMTLWKTDDFVFAIAIPFDGESATYGNGTMVGFQVSSAEAVEKMHSTAIRLGAKNEGAPGKRSGGTAAYVRDLDGNKLCFFE